jgi:hypothetical protein
MFKFLNEVLYPDDAVSGALAVSVGYGLAIADICEKD